MKSILDFLNIFIKKLYVEEEHHKFEIRRVNANVYYFIRMYNYYQKIQRFDLEKNNQF